MKRIIFVIITAGMLLVVLTACTQYMDTCERYVLVAVLCALPDRNEYRQHDISMVVPREFFDAVDFGRGHNSLDGDPPYRYDEDYGRFDNIAFRHHGHCGEWEHRHRGPKHSWLGSYRDYEYSFSERYAPLMLPDIE